MRSLFQISDDLLALAVALEDVDGEITEDEKGAILEDWFNNLGAERDQKIDNYCAFIRELEAKASARQDEASRLNGLAWVDFYKAERLRKRLKLFFDAQHIAKLETARFKLGIQKNGGRSPLIIPGRWEEEPGTAPEQFHRRVIELDRTAIREALEDGEEIDGCRIGERGTQLRIR